MTCLLLGASCTLIFDQTGTGAKANDAGLDVADGGQRAMFSDDFESGQLDPRWTRSLENGDTCSVTADQPRSGTYSLRCDTDGSSGTRAAVYVDFDPTNTIRVEMDVRFDNVPAWYVDFLQASYVTDSANLRLANADYYSSGQIDAWNFATKDFAYVNLPIATGTWYHIDFRVRTSETDGAVSVVVDGDSDNAARLTGINTTNNPINRLLFGITLVMEAVEMHTVYVDNIVVTEG